MELRGEKPLEEKASANRDLMVVITSEEVSNDQDDRNPTAMTMKDVGGFVEHVDTDQSPELRNSAAIKIQ